MNSDITEYSSEATQDLINQIESCLAKRLLRRQFSDIHYPVSDLIPPSIIRASHSSDVSEDLYDWKAVSPNRRQENSRFSEIPTGGNKRNQSSKASSLCEPNSSTGIEPSSPLRAVIGMQPEQNWRLKSQMCSKNGISSSQTSAWRAPFSSNQLVTLNADGNAANSTPKRASSYSNKEQVFTLLRLSETQTPNGEKKVLRSKLNRLPDVRKSESSSKRETNEEHAYRKRFTRAKTCSQECSTLVKNREPKFPEGISERQLNGHKALQRRLEYDPQASVAKERFRLKVMGTQGPNILPKKSENHLNNARNESTEALKSRPTRRLLSSDSRSVQTQTSKQNDNTFNGLSSSQTSVSQKARPVITASKDAHKRATTNSPFGRTQSQQRGIKPKSILPVNHSSRNIDSAVETISHKLERLATYMVRLRKLVERDYSETGYCSAGDDIYVDEEVGAMSNGKPTGMHPSIASSLRSIRLLEANVQEIFDLLYANEAQIWCPVGLKTD